MLFRSHPDWQPRCSSNRTDMPPPQGLCTCCSLCLGCSSLGYWHGLPLTSCGCFLKCPVSCPPSLKLHHPTPCLIPSSPLYFPPQHLTSSTRYSSLNLFFDSPTSTEAVRGQALWSAFFILNLQCFELALAHTRCSVRSS